MFVIGRLGDGFLEGLGRFPPDHVVYAFQIPPPFPCGQQSGYGVCQSVFERRHHDAACAARHSLHIAEHEGRGDGVRLARSAAGDDHGGLCADVLCQELGAVEVNSVLMEFRFHVPLGKLRV